MEERKALSILQNPFTATGFFLSLSASKEYLRRRTFGSMVSITEKSLRVVAKAMAIADETESCPIPSFSSQLAEVKRGPLDLLSPEDIDWVDSCFKDPDASQIDWDSWNSFSLALSETLSSETDSSAARIENRPEGAVIEISPSRQQIGGAKIMGTGAVSDSSITEGAAEKSEDQLINEQTDVFHSEINLENVFLPTWNESLENFLAPNTEKGVDFPGFVMEHSTGDIFKVWDLGLPVEEDEFINQLNKALAQSSLEPSPSVSDDSGMLKGLQDIAIDDIVSGMSDLSLNRFPMQELP